MGKRDIAIREEDIITIEQAEKYRKGKKNLNRNDFLHNEENISQFLDRRIPQTMGEMTAIKIPVEVKKNLPEAPNQWEALELYFNHRAVDMIIKNVQWEISQVIANEPEPEIWEYEYNNGETETRVKQHGELYENRYPDYSMTGDADNHRTFIGRLADLYYSVHYIAFQRAWKENKPEYIQNLQKDYTKKLMENAKKSREEIHRLKEKLKEKDEEIEQINKNNEIERNKIQNQLNFIENKNKKEYDHNLAKLIKTIKVMEEQMELLETGLTWKQRRVWANTKWDKWREHTAYYKESRFKLR